jgi:hypothetical protein
MKKVKQLLCMVITVRSTSNGPLPMLIKLKKMRPRVLTKNTVSISTDHSISDQDFQCKESFSVTEPIMSS